jgi:hypothetical protein
VPRTGLPRPPLLPPSPFSLSLFLLLSCILRARALVKNKDAEGEKFSLFG